MNLSVAGVFGEALQLSQVLPFLCMHRWIESGTSAWVRVHLHLDQLASS